jgi:hypothetical protein
MSLFSVVCTFQKRREWRRFLRNYPTVNVHNLPSFCTQQRVRKYINTERNNKRLVLARGGGLVCHCLLHGFVQLVTH